MNPQGFFVYFLKVKTGRMGIGQNFGCSCTLSMPIIIALALLMPYQQAL
jgi:hypothetical protein